MQSFITDCMLKSIVDMLLFVGYASLKAYYRRWNKRRIGEYQKWKSGNLSESV